jgi:co-chaperonin GroES (HSP10)
MEYKLPSNHALVKLLPAEEKKTKSGIFIEGAGIKASATVGVVLAIGPGVYHGEKLVAPLFGVGDKIYFNTKAAMEWSPTVEEDYWIVAEKDIYAYVSADTEPANEE